MKTKLFLDGGDPAETREAVALLGFLDGQTTNPTLISKNPAAQGKKFSQQEIFAFYQSVVEELSHLLPNGSISIEVPADENTTADEMLAIGRQMFTWIPNAHIKYPTIPAGLEAAERSVNEGMRVNMTLVFSQPQAAAVYSATQKTGESSLPNFKNVFVSPFVGRLDDRGENGMDLIGNTINMYGQSDHHVAVLTASVRNINHFLYALQLESDIITAPLALYKEWHALGMPLPDQNFHYDGGNLKPIPYQELDLHKPWREFDIAHDLTTAGIKKFTDDWNALLS